MVHLLIIKVNFKEIDGVPVTGTPVDSRTVIPSWTPIIRKSNTNPIQTKLFK